MRPDASATCSLIANFVLTDGPLKLWGGAAKKNDVYAWGSWAAMSQLGVHEIAEHCPSIQPAAHAWRRSLLDAYLEPGKPADRGIAGERWPRWCDEQGIPPVLFIGGGGPRDHSAVAEFAKQAATYPRMGKVDGLGELSDGALARRAAGVWPVPTPRENENIITLADDAFICNAVLAQGVPELGAASRPYLEIAARRLLAVARSGQRDPADGLYWHGFDVANGEHSCCKWGDASGWVGMAFADVLRGFQLSNQTSSAQYAPLVTAFQDLAQAYVKAQDAQSGMWHQLIDDASTYESSSATGFALYALMIGSRELHLLNSSDVQTAIGLGWNALQARVQPDGSVVNLSPGEGLKASRAEYLRKSNSSLLWGLGAVLRACAARLRHEKG